LSTILISQWRNIGWLSANGTQFPFLNLRVDRHGTETCVDLRSACGGISRFYSIIS
jgi:hypothetical protein